MAKVCVTMARMNGAISKPARRRQKRPKQLPPPRELSQRVRKQPVRYRDPT